jgi:hypothetical protein
MQLKNLATASFGVLLSLKAMAYDKELYGVDMTRIESDKKIPGNEKFSYKIPTNYQINDYCAFDAAAIGKTSESSAIFGTHIAPCERQSLLDLPLNEEYVFTAALQLPETVEHCAELETATAAS